MEMTNPRRTLKRAIGLSVSGLFLALALAFAGCGSSDRAVETTVSGVVSSDGPVDRTVSLTDASEPAQHRTSEVDDAGSFVFDVAGLTSPYLLEATATRDGEAFRMSSLSPDGGWANINPITDAAVKGADDDDDDGESEQREDEGERRRRKAKRFEILIGLLQSELKPLFDLYEVPADPFTDGRKDDALRAMLKDVRVRVSPENVVEVTNKKTGGVIFAGPLSDLASGTFQADNMPGGAGTPPPLPPPPPPDACTYTYGDWGACQPDGTQTRTVAAATPAGCVGTPATSQACTYVPPAPPTLDGAALYGQKCSGCHGPLATSTRLGRTAAQITATHGSMVTAAEAEAIAGALATTTPPPPPPPPAACTYTYGAWGACQPDGTQTRTVAAATPAGCVGTPATSQACTYVPPVTTCSAFTYSAWGACQSDDTQTRTVTSSSPAGCTGGTPVTSQACTYVPPVCTYTYSEWSTCSTGGTQTRTVVSSSPAGCAGTPVLSQTCTPPPPTTASCTTCHGIPPATGRHSRHASLATCATCHGSGYSTTTANAATHQNGVKDLTTTIGWNATSRSCANSCHGSKSW